MSPHTPGGGRARPWIHRGRLRTVLVLCAAVVGRPTPTTLALGFALIVVGGAWHLWSKGTLVQNRQLACTGPYRWCRNPFYFANLLIDFGIAAASGVGWLALALVPAWALAYGPTIAREEAFLAQKFGAAFEAFRARVPRLFPWRGRRRLPAALLPPGPGFSWVNKNLVHGREYSRLVRIFAAPLVVQFGWMVKQGHLLHPSRFTRADLAVIALLIAIEITREVLARKFGRPRRGDVEGDGEPAPGAAALARERGR